MPFGYRQAITSTSALDSKQESIGETIFSNAYLIINGSETFTINSTLVNIGRGSENQLVLDDLRVSRKHAQLRFINGHFVIFDLNSSGGTYINGQRIVQSVLYTGDVISLAGLPLIFSYENASPLGETQPLKPAIS
jgi:pSer/pThr/pTyr-binding forkhead associated (FHA) protein